MDLEDMVSPSDMGLIELAGGMLDNLQMVKDIFASRNPKDVTISFATGVATTAAVSMTSININATDFMEFLSDQYEKYGSINV